MSLSSHQRPHRGATDIWLTPPEIIAALGPFCRWGHGQGKPSEMGRACGNCLVRGQMTFDNEGDAA